VPGSDFDGDGKTDPARYNSGTGELRYLASSTGTWVYMYVGTGSQYQYVPSCDFDGDGKTDPTKFNSSFNELRYLKSTTGTWGNINLGAGTIQVAN
jgi:hypothetical protein